jgi:hypothetical protein
VGVLQGARPLWAGRVHPAITTMQRAEIRNPKQIQMTKGSMLKKERKGTYEIKTNLQE